MRWSSAVLVALLLAVACPAQQGSLTTSFAGGNGCSGNLFDVVATVDVTVCSFDVHVDPVPVSFNVYAVTGGGSWNQPGVVSTPAAWTLLATVAVTGAGVGTPTPLNLNLGYQIPAGVTQGFAIELVNTGPVVWYTNGGSYGNPLVNNADIAILEGGGLCNTTTGQFTPNAPRNWNGTIYYELGLNPTCVGGPAIPYQTNNSVSSLDVNGVIGTAFTSAASNACVGEIVNMNSSGTGNYEIGVAFAPTVAGGIGTTAGAQVVNLNIGDPSFFFLNGGSIGLLIPHPGTFAMPLTTPNVLTASGQQMVTDAGHPDGFQLSQAPELTVTVGSGSTPVTLQDDNFVQMMLPGPPLCGTTVDFYGTTYTDFFVESNGGVTFQMGSGDFTATASEWQSQMPRLGISADLEPNNYGTVTVTNNGAAGIGNWITVAYSNVTEWGTAGMGVTSFNVELHGPNGHEIGGFMTDGTWGATPVVGGITLGAGGTHPMLVSFDVLFGMGLQANANTTDSVIDENTAGMLANTNGWTSVQFPSFDGSAYLVQ